MSIRKVVALCSVFGLCIAGMMLGGPLTIFLDPTSVVIWSGIVVGGIFWSHSLRDLKSALATFWGAEPLDETRALQDSATFFRLAELSTAVGWVGTLIGLIQMLQNMSDPTAIGPAMAVALLTMLYGVIGSELIFRPAAANCLVRALQSVPDGGAAS
ncbi:MAG: hypothetical protein CL930_10935 [Deltaproteobacteria bacterium]|nr:hypothetical protein [Deltaproteobacteria bacterium]